MADFIARLFEPLLRFRRSGREGHRPTDSRAYERAYPYPYPCACACACVGGPVAHRTGERPAREGTGPLVRPHLDVHERQLAEVRRQRTRRRALRLAVHGADAGPRSLHGVEVGA
ncbi:hypothetical protein [Streptomyces sp. Wb2n-11]|uniref:hypothetical protein n=1 Tax=Streptomyces sp. Wb2n-11 TaxID=1030533 RepID=UPI000B113B24|nr:hypothetical protein [Streptomyces sp. Wb2n-11]